MPDIGFDDEPISPVNRDETVTKRKPSMMIRSAPRIFIFSDGVSVITTTRPSIPMTTHLSDISCSVRGSVPSAPAALSARLAWKSEMLPRIPFQIVGRERIREIIPPAVTAPAPMYKIYSLWMLPEPSIGMSLINFVAGASGSVSVSPKNRSSGSAPNKPLRRRRT